MRYAKKINISSWKGTIFGAIAAAIFLFVYYIFPSNEGSGLAPFLQTLTKGVFLLILGPFLFVKFILRKDFCDYGFNLRNKKRGFISAGTALVFSLILSYILIRHAAFLKSYQLQPIVIVNFWFFLLRELVFLNILLFIQLCFFQGFILSIFSEKFLYGAIFLQAALFLLPNLLSRAHPFSYLPFLVIALVGGIVSYISRTFIYSYFYSLSYFVLLDFCVIYAIKHGL